MLTLVCTSVSATMIWGIGSMTVGRWLSTGWYNILYLCELVCVLMLHCFLHCRAIGDGWNGWYEMTCTLDIDAEILKHPVAYKYIVYSPKMEKEDDCYEYLHGYWGIANRCLRIPQNKFSKVYGGKCMPLLCVLKLQCSQTSFHVSLSAYF